MAARAAERGIHFISSAFSEGAVDRLAKLGMRFTNAHWVRDLLCEEAAGRPELRHLVLMMSGVNEIDLSGLEALQQLALELRSQGRQLHLSELKGPVADRLIAAGLEVWLPGRVFRTQMDAWQALMAAPGEAAAHWVSP